MRAMIVSLVLCLWSVGAYAEPFEAPLRSHSAWRGGPADFTRSAPQQTGPRTLTQRLIQQVIGRNRAGVRSCLAYAVGFRPDALGMATVAVQVDVAGRVASARLVETADARFGRCVESIVRRWRFPVDAAASGVLRFDFAAQ